MVSQADIDLILSVSNNFRIKVATGSETRGSPGPQPAASNMRKLVDYMILSTIFKKLCSSLF